MAKQTITQKEPVKLREKKLSNGNISLFLDIYRNGKRHKEYLKLYLIDAKTPIEKEQNRQTLATAQAIKSKRLIEIQNGEYSFTHQFKENTPFLGILPQYGGRASQESGIKRELGQLEKLSPLSRNLLR